MQSFILVEKKNTTLCLAESPWLSTCAGHQEHQRSQLRNTYLVSRTLGRHQTTREHRTRAKVHSVHLNLVRILLRNFSFKKVQVRIHKTIVKSGQGFSPELTDLIYYMLTYITYVQSMYLWHIFVPSQKNSFCCPCLYSRDKPQINCYDRVD